MVTLMNRPWFLDLVERELAEATAWRLSKYANPANTALNDCRFEDNGSSISIRPILPKSKRNAQIVRFHPSDPSKAQLSDAALIIRVKFSKESLAKYRNEKLYPFARLDNLGGIIHINDLEIRITSYGSIEEQLTLFIIDFNNFVASTGSPTFNLPGHAHENKTVRSLLEGLAKVEELDCGQRALDSSEHVQSTALTPENLHPSPCQSWVRDPVASALAPATQGAFCHVPNRPTDMANGPMADVQNSKVSAPNPLIPVCTGHGDAEQDETSSQARHLLSLVRPRLASKCNISQPAIAPNQPSNIAKHPVTWTFHGNGRSSNSEHSGTLRGQTAPTTYETSAHHCAPGFSGRHVSLLAAENFWDFPFDQLNFKFTNHQMSFLHGDDSWASPPNTTPTTETAENTAQCYRAASPRSNQAQQSQTEEPTSKKSQPKHPHSVPENESDPVEEMEEDDDDALEWSPSPSPPKRHDEPLPPDSSGPSADEPVEALPSISGNKHGKLEMSSDTQRSSPRDGKVCRLYKHALLNDDIQNCCTSSVILRRNDNRAPVQSANQLSSYNDDMHGSSDIEIEAPQVLEADQIHSRVEAAKIPYNHRNRMCLNSVMRSDEMRPNSPSPSFSRTTQKPSQEQSIPATFGDTAIVENDTSPPATRIDYSRAFCHGGQDDTQQSPNKHSDNMSIGSNQSSGESRANRTPPKSYQNLRQAPQTKPRRSQSSSSPASSSLKRPRWSVASAEAQTRKKVAKLNFPLDLDLQESSIKHPMISAREEKREFIRRSKATRSKQSSSCHHSDGFMTRDTTADGGVAITNKANPPQKDASERCQQSTTQSIADGPEHDNAPSLARKVFTSFCRAYADYKGDMRHFTGMCRQLMRLEEAGKSLHRSLWDDFIARHRDDYVDYMSACNAEGEDPMPYEQYYNEQIEGSTHDARVVNPQNAQVVTDEQAPGPGSCMSPPNWKEVVNEVDQAPAEAYFQESQSPRENSATDQTQCHSNSAPGSKAEKNDGFMETSAEIRSSLKGSLPEYDPHSRASLISESTAECQGAAIAVAAPRRTEVRMNGEQTVSKPEPGHPLYQSRSRSVPPGSASRQQHLQIEPESGIAQEEEEEEEEDATRRRAWWQDSGAPFKEWARAYTQLKSVKGSLGKVDEKGRIRGRREIVDILNWTL